LAEGKYEITIYGVDKASNKSQKIIPIEISRVTSMPKNDIKFDYNLILVIIAIVIAIGISIFIILSGRSQKSQKY
jgi:hypothetical protein